MRIEVFINGRPAGVFRSGFGRFTVDISALAAGRHQLRLVAFDRFPNDRVVEAGSFEKAPSSSGK